jgi:hypothetical protein
VILRRLGRAVPSCHARQGWSGLSPALARLRGTHLAAKKPLLEPSKAPVGAFLYPNPPPRRHAGPAAPAEGIPSAARVACGRMARLTHAPTGSLDMDEGIRLGVSVPPAFSMPSGVWAVDRLRHVPTDGVTSPPRERPSVDTHADAREIIIDPIRPCQEKSSLVWVHHCHTFVMGVAASSMVSWFVPVFGVMYL